MVREEGGLELLMWVMWEVVGVEKISGLGSKEDKEKFDKLSGEKIV